MEKLRIIVTGLGILIAGILAFSLTKSWFVYDRGIQIQIEEPSSANSDTSPEKSIDLSAPKEKEIGEDWPEDAKILWKNYLVYPVGLHTESGGFGPDGVMNHAKNLVMVNLKTGRKWKLFEKNVYIWDFFPGEFKKRSGFTTTEEPKIDTLDLESRLLIFAAPLDTNMDGFLNHKDRKKVFIFESGTEKLVEVLPENSFFEKLFWNSGKNRLALVIRSLLVEESDGPLKIRTSEPQFFIFDASTGKSSITNMVE
jgi:hypothetical protein